MKILFLYLKAFSATGGIEKFNRAFMLALQEISQQNGNRFESISAYDDKADERYITLSSFRGYKGNRIRFTISAIRKALNANTIFFGHINLALVGLVISLLKPNTKIILIAHGIEVWRDLGYIKKKFLKRCNKILAVSNFTKNKMIEKHQLNSNSITVFHNTLDPYFIIPKTFEKPDYLLKRYSLKNEIKIILTLTRINNNEEYKGYDKIIEALPRVLERFPNTVYILAGKYDEYEKERIMSLVAKYKLKANFILTGFIGEKELTDHYLLADVFVMPSKKEGFGIVFIEAAACGIPIIAGNEDGSVDALKNGMLGELIDPDDSELLVEKVSNTFSNNNFNKQTQSFTSTTHFHFEQFKTMLSEVVLK